MLPLEGIGVLITRPSHQAASLGRLFEAAGAAAVFLPAIDIRPLVDAPTRAPQLATVEKFELIIFSSANAVRFGAALLEERRDLPLAAIGPATARALNQAGYRVSVQPAEGFDSESLLRHPHLLAVAGQRVLIVKGKGGRDLLERELERRGASLTLAEVYCRECPAPDAGELRNLTSRFARHEIHLITATSAEIGHNLLALATPALRRHFDAASWLVPSARVAALLRDAGLRAAMVTADSAEDQDLLSAAVCWRSSVSGA